MPATVHVLGTCGGWPEVGRACSGLLVSADGHRLVLDLGYGAFARLLEVLPAGAAGVDAVVVSHAHPDHLVDVHAVYRARLWGPGPPGRLPLLAPPEVPAVLARMDPGGSSGDLEEVFDLVDLPGPARSLGPWTLTSVATPHYVPNVAVRLEGAGTSLACTGDGGPTDDLVDLVRGVDLLVCEASDVGQRDASRPPDGLLMSGEDAGLLARRAGVGRLVLTHFWPGNDREVTRRAAEDAFGGPVECAAEDGPPLVSPAGRPRP